MELDHPAELPLTRKRQGLFGFPPRNSLDDHKPPSALPKFGHQLWGTRGRSRHASFTSDQMGIQKEQHPRISYPAEVEMIHRHVGAFPRE